MEPEKQNTFPEISMQEVRSHVTEDDCWTVINGVVYNLSEWVKKHPGGKENILAICGRDGSYLFNGQHGGALTPRLELEKMKIGHVSVSKSKTVDNINH